MAAEKADVCDKATLVYMSSQIEKIKEIVTSLTTPVGAVPRGDTVR